MSASASRRSANHSAPEAEALAAFLAAEATAWHDVRAGFMQPLPGLAWIKDGKEGSGRTRRRASPAAAVR